MSTLTFTIQANGVADAEDRRAMLLIINEENARRAAFNSTTPLPVAPLALLPFATGAERKTSYETVQAIRLTQIHAKYIKQAGEQADIDPAFKDLRPLWIDATPAKKAAAVAALQ